MGSTSYLESLSKMLERSLAEQITDLKDGEYSSTELTAAYLEKIDSCASLNSYISVAQNAMEQAKTADQKRAAGDSSALLGIPIAHKDIFCQKGTTTTAGSQMLHNFISPYNATVVEKLNRAGVVNLGKTNMDEFAMGSSNESSFYGSVKNPWDPDRVPGGSSGGSAAAVAARLCSAATGTDTGGSIRQPAAFCGVTGIKPTYGRISRWGMIAYASSLDQAGPIARTAEDCAMLLTYMAGHDPKDSTSSTQPVSTYYAQLSKPLSGLKVGICSEHLRELAPTMNAILGKVIEELQVQGALIREISLPNSSTAIPAYYIIAPAECSANLARYDGVRFGYRCEKPVDLNDLYRRSRSESFGAEVKSRIMVGTFALSAGYYDAYYRKAQQIRRLIKNDFVNAFAEVDVIIGPTTPQPAFKLNEKSEDSAAMYMQDVFTIPINLAGLPAISVPAGFIEGMPVGVQFIGNYFCEERLLNLAYQYQTATDWHMKQPEAKI